MDLSNFCKGVIGRDGTVESKFDQLLDYFITHIKVSEDINNRCYLMKKLLYLIKHDIKSSTFELESRHETFLNLMLGEYLEFPKFELRYFHRHLKRLFKDRKASFLFCKVRFLIAKQLEIIRTANTSSNQTNKSTSNSEDEEEAPNKLPRSLEILKNFWNDTLNDELSDDQKQFMSFYLNELIEAASKLPRSSFLREELESSICDVLQYLYGFKFNAGFEQQTGVNYATPDMSICEKVLELFLPENLVQLKRNNQNQSNSLLIPVIKHFRPLIDEQIPVNVLSKFHKYIMDQINFAYRRADEKNCRPIFQQDFMKGLPQIEDISDKQRTLFTRALFILAQDMNTNVERSFGEIIKLLNNVFVLDKCWIDSLLFNKLYDNLIDSIPTCICTTTTNPYQLLDRLNYFLSLLVLTKTENVARIHLELGLILFTHSTHLKRYSNACPTKTEAPNLKLKAERMLIRCKLHFLFASESEELLPQDQWPAFYFLGKIGEKSEYVIMCNVVSNYQKCLHLMEKSACKMSGTKNKIDHKSLEIFYRILRFLDKQRREAFVKKDLQTLQNIITLLKHFSIGSTNKKRSLFSSNWLCVDLKELLNGNSSTEIASTVNQLNEEALQLIEQGYLNIQQQREHYKTLFRLFELASLKTQNVPEITNDVFHSLLESKKGSIASIFAKYTFDFQKYFRRVGSADYHIGRMFHFAMDKYAKNLSLKRLLQFLSNMLCDHENGHLNGCGISSNNMTNLIKKSLLVCCDAIEQCNSGNRVLEDPATACLELLNKIQNKLKNNQLNAAKTFIKLADSFMQLHSKGSGQRQEHSPISSPQSPITSSSTSDVHSPVKSLQSLVIDSLLIRDTTADQNSSNGVPKQAGDQIIISKCQDASIVSPDSSSNNQLNSLEKLLSTKELGCNEVKQLFSLFIDSIYKKNGSKVESLNEKVKQTCDEKAEVEGKLSQAETSQQILLSQCTDLMSQKDNACKQRDSIKAEMEALKSENAKLLEENKSFKIHIDALKSENVKLINENSLLNSNLNKADTTTTEVKNENETLKRKLKEAELQNEEDAKVMEALVLKKRRRTTADGENLQASNLLCN